jgi:hypothetical protein
VWDDSYAHEVVWRAPGSHDDPLQLTSRQTTALASMAATEEEEGEVMDDQYEQARIDFEAGEPDAAAFASSEPRLILLLSITHPDLLPEPPCAAAL